MPAIPRLFLPYPQFVECLHHAIYKGKARKACNNQHHNHYFMLTLTRPVPAIDILTTHLLAYLGFLLATFSRSWLPALRSSKPDRARPMRHHMFFSAILLRGTGVFGSAARR